LSEHGDPPDCESDLFLKGGGYFREDFQEVCQEVNCNCKPETLQFFEELLLHLLLLLLLSHYQYLKV
jgi:hypothetical protein